MQNKQINEPPFPWTDAPHCEGLWGVYTSYVGEWKPVEIESFYPLKDISLSIAYRVTEGCDEYIDAWIDEEGYMYMSGDKHAAYWYRLEWPPIPDEV